jgi:ribosome biogenesis protein ERB1
VNWELSNSSAPLYFAHIDSFTESSFTNNPFEPSTSTMPPKQPSRSNARASGSKSASSLVDGKPSAVKGRKRAQVEPESEDELAGLEAVGIDQKEDEEDEEELELDTGSSDGDDEDEGEGDLRDFLVEDVAGEQAQRISRQQRQQRRSRAEPSDEDQLSSFSSDEEDSQAGLGLDDEEGYNSSDIDALSSSSHASSFPNKTPRDEPTLDELFSRHTTKPNETEYSLTGSVATGGRALEGDGRWRTGKFSSAKEGMGRKRESRYAKGSYVREYDEIEAGYGSESSTEDVSSGPLFKPFFSSPWLTRLRTTHVEPEYDRKHSY